MNRFLPASLAALALVTAFPCRADITLPALISDNMVLQQHAKVNVWGKADPNENITIQIGSDSTQAMAGKDGTWAVRLPGLKAGGPYEMTISGKNSLVVHNVAVGDVWVCSGESNMEFKTIAATNGPAETQQAVMYPMARVFIVKHAASETPQADCQGSWAVCDPSTAGNFSAIAYFFARELNPAMRVPIGIIQSAWGPSPAVAWTPRATLEKDPALHAALDRYAQAVAAYPDALSAYKANLAAAQAAGSPSAHAPIEPLDPSGPREPSALYNGMIAPLLRYPIRGVLWYQGESDTADPALYRKLFPAMIGAWRKAWNQTDLPFFYAQLSSFLTRHPQPVASRWAELREAQSQALSLPKTGMAVTIDTGDEHTMHPPDKQDAAHRLALLAETQVYGKTGLAASGPVFAGMKIDGAKAILSFTHEEGGLVAKNGAPLKGFAIAGADQKFVWADAAIQDGKVIVQSKDVPKPAAVRYAWADTPDCDLFNKANLPAPPFRTDTWPQ